MYAVPYHTSICISKEESGDRIHEVERVLSLHLSLPCTTEGMGWEATLFPPPLYYLWCQALFYKLLADSCLKEGHHVHRLDELYSLLRSAAICIRGSRSKSHRVPNASLELGATESALWLSITSMNCYFVL